MCFKNHESRSFIMPFFLLCLAFLLFGSSIFSESLNLETNAADSGIISPDVGSNSIESNVFVDSKSSGTSGVKSAKSDIGAFDLSFNGITPGTPANIHMDSNQGPDIPESKTDPGSPGMPCLSDPIIDDTTQNAKAKRQTLLSDWLPNWMNPWAPLWCPKPDSDNQLLPKPQRPSPPESAPSSPPVLPPVLPPESAPPAPYLRPGGKPSTNPKDFMNPEIDGGEDYGEVRSCRNLKPDVYSTVICGGPPFPQDLVQEADYVYDCWRCTCFSILYIIMNLEPLFFSSRNYVSYRGKKTKNIRILERAQKDSLIIRWDFSNDREAD